MTQYCSDKCQIPCTRPLNPPILGDFELRTPLSTLADRAISWGAGGPSAMIKRLIEQYWKVTDHKLSFLLLLLMPSLLKDLAIDYAPVILPSQPARQVL
jgi:hypothetical protein